MEFRLNKTVCKCCYTEASKTHRILTYEAFKQMWKEGHVNCFYIKEISAEGTQIWNYAHTYINEKPLKCPYFLEHLVNQR
jgi:hypothetical protein